MNTVALPDVTGMPVWQPDQDALECFLCHRSFSFFFRRHHCRKCGKVVCGKCSSNQRKVSTTLINPPSHFRFESYLVPRRTCNPCTEELDMIREALEEADNASFAFGGSLLQSSSVPFISSTVDIAKNNEVTENTRCVENENDFCPICNTRISGLSELSRESHVNDCLEKAQFSGSPEVARSPNRMIVYRLPSNFEGFKHHTKDKEKKIFSESLIDDATCQSYDSSGIGNLHEDSSRISNLISTNLGPSNSLHDTYESEDESNECCICLEPFKPKSKVGRLECLCVFHYDCINAWFKRRGPGECPVHAVHS